MKTSRLLVSVTAVLSLWISPLTATSQVVDIPDPELNAAIRMALDKPTGDITVADMESLTELDASVGPRGGYDAHWIESLEGLQAARNLTSLDLSGTKGDAYITRANLGTSDLSPLAQLTSLATLDLSYNHRNSFTFPEEFRQSDHA